jgi:hypothetical protein
VIDNNDWKKPESEVDCLNINCNNLIKSFKCLQTVFRCVRTGGANRFSVALKSSGSYQSQEASTREKGLLRLGKV